MAVITYAFLQSRRPSQAGRKKVSRPPPQSSLPAVQQAILLEQNDEWTVQRARYMALEPSPH